MTRLRHEAPRAAGAALSFAIGVSAVIVLLMLVRPDSAPRAATFPLTVSILRPGALDVVPAGVVLALPRARQGAVAQKTVMVRNQSPNSVAVRVRAREPSGMLDRVLVMTVRVGDRTLVDGVLATARNWSVQESVSLAPGASTPLSLRVVLASLAGPVTDTDIEVELLAKPLVRSR